MRFFVFALVLSVSIFAQAKAGFVKVDGDRELYVDYEKASPGQPTFVLLNGLTYSLSDWNRFVEQLRGNGAGILRYDMMGQGETLLKYAPVTAAIAYENQVEDLSKLLATLNITENIQIVGLSYGGAIAIQFAASHPEQVKNLILMAPYTEALKDQDTWIRFQVQQTRIMFPANPASFDELYDYFLRTIVYSSYPVAEPTVLKNPYILESVFRLTQGVRKFEAVRVARKLPLHRVHMMIARQDQYIDNSVHDKFWDALPAEARASRLYIEGSEHKIPEAVPKFAASWVKRIASGDPALFDGRSFAGNANGEVRVEEGK